MLTLKKMEEEIERCLKTQSKPYLKRRECNYKWKREKEKIYQNLSGLRLSNHLSWGYSLYQANKINEAKHCQSTLWKKNESDQKVLFLTCSWFELSNVANFEKQIWPKVKP